MQFEATGAAGPLHPHDQCAFSPVMFAAEHSPPALRSRGRALQLKRHHMHTARWSDRLRS